MYQYSLLCYFNFKICQAAGSDCGAVGSIDEPLGPTDDLLQ